jgi:Cys-rich protein (TIGR01571 family)
MAQTTTTVVTKQVTSRGGSTVVTTGNRDWHSTLGSCCDDTKSCLCGAFCLPCYMSLLSKRLGECCCAMWASGVTPMRTKVRMMLGIQGTVCRDFIASTFCPWCVACQMGRELDASGWPK